MEQTQHDQDLKEQGSTDDALLRVARSRFTQAEEAEAPQRHRQLAALRFRSGDQWPQAIRHQRDMEKRPCLTINRANAFVHQVTNEQRQQPPSLKVSPVDSGSDIEVARIFQGLMRHIEVDSNAEAAYMTAFEHAVTHGRGYVRLLLDYADPFSFDLCVSIGRIQNPLSVYVDPACRTLDYSDMQWAFITQTLDRDQFCAQYPEVNPSTMDQWSTMGDGWVRQHEVRLAEYFYIERHMLDIALLDDGTVLPVVRVPEGVPMVQQRRTMVPVVHHCKIAGHVVLERTEWPGKYIPIIPVLGEELLVDGRIHYNGLIATLEDAQRMYNFWATAGTELIALAPRAPWLLNPTQIKGYERFWQTANTGNHPYLPYTPTTTGGAPDPLPQRQAFEPPVAAISQFMMFAADDMKSTSGIYDASLGARSNETSGKAIQSRQQQGNTANYHFSAALGTSMRHIGRCLVDLIPKVYDQQRVVRIIGDDNEQRVVTVNAPYEDEAGNEKFYDLQAGKYDVVVNMGPSYQTKRQETVDAMSSLAQAYPPLLERAGDLIFKHMDWPGADELARRFKKMLPPNLLEESDKPEDQVPQMQAAMQQMQQQLEALNAYAQEQEAQSQEITQENAQLKQQMQGKAGELALKEEELALKERELELKIEIEREKLAIEREKVDLEAMQMQHEVRMAAAQSNGKKDE